MRVVLDTNILVSALLVKTGLPARIIERIEQFELLCSDETLAELERVLRYPRIQRKYSLTEEVITGFIQRVRDASACAIAGTADYIVSGDADLLVIDDYAGIPIVPPAVFLNLLMA